MLRQHEANGVTYFTFPQLTALGVHHVIGTRLGGVSSPPFDTLNVSLSVGDDPQRVEENRRRLAALVDIAPTQLVTAWLVHGRDVARVNGEHRGHRIPYYDALMTNEPGVPLFMTFADCLPIIVYDPVRRAVALAHAGWRGTAAGIMEHTLLAMHEAYGTRPQEVIVGFGPAIRACHYEVGPDVVEAFRLLGRTPPVLHPADNGHARLDLVETNRRQAASLGVSEFLTASHCTACHTDLFFSHRAEHGQTGRFGVVVVLA